MAISVGAAYYTRLSLYVYDTWVLFLSCSLAWCCSTRRVVLPFFQSHVGPQHLDIGVGTGYFPSQAAASPQSPVRHFTLVDLNPNCLSVAKDRIISRSGYSVKTVVADALRPNLLPNELRGSFDSISLVYLLHTLPGPPQAKANVFRHAKAYLKEEGVLFGTTVLGYGVRHNWFGRLLLGFYNWTGIFDNSVDGKEEFVEALKEEFGIVETKLVGRVLLFVASSPISSEN